MVVLITLDISVTKLSAFRMFRRRSVDAIVLSAVFLIVVSDVAAETAEPHEVATGFLSVPADEWRSEHPEIERYVQFVQGVHHAQAWQSQVTALYAPRVYFSDSFIEIDNRPELVAYLGKIRDSTRSMDFQVLDVLEGRQGTYLLWQLETTLAFLGNEKQVSTFGGTLFRYDDAGRVIFQKDIWDSTEGFFRHVPILGSMIEVVRRQVGG